MRMASAIAAADEQLRLRQLPRVAQQLHSSIKRGSGNWLVRRFPTQPRRRCSLSLQRKCAVGTHESWHSRISFAPPSPTLRSSALRTKDQRNQVVQDTVLSYAELEKWQQRLDRLREIYPDVQKMEAAVADRVKEGVDSEMDNSRARLSVARMRLRLAEASGAADVLREHLSKLTGLPVAIHRDRCRLSASFARSPGRRESE